MRVGVIVDNELNDDKRVLREIKILKDAGYEIFVLCFSFSNRFRDKIEGINISKIKISKKAKDILFFFLNTIPAYEWLWSSKIKKFIKINRIDILHVHDLYMSQAARSGIMKSGRELPIVLDLHENYPFAVTTYNWTKGFLRNLISQPHKWKIKEKDLLSYPRKIIVLCDEFREKLLDEYKFLSRENFCVFPNVPDMEQMKKYKINHEKIPFAKKSPIIFYFGVVAERRGIFNSLNAFKDVIDRGYDAVLLIVGPIDKKDRENFYDSVTLPAIKQHIIYIPWIDISELPSYLDLSDICLAPFIKNPQHESGVANKIFDYMAGGRPIIASDCLPQQKLIEKYECGIIYRNQQEFSDSIIKLLSDRDLCRRLGENGNKTVIKEFNIEIKKANLIDAYDSIRNHLSDFSL
jgi:glycosyltransferase involved in cell wall biosynthesis